MKTEPRLNERAYRELDEEDEYPVRRPAQRPRAEADDDEYKETLADWYASEAAAQERLEEAHMIWLNRLRNRDLDRLERARRGIPARENGVKNRGRFGVPRAAAGR